MHTTQSLFKKTVHSLRVGFSGQYASCEAVSVSVFLFAAGCLCKPAALCGPVENVRVTSEGVCAVATCDGFNLVHCDHGL